VENISNDDRRILIIIIDVKRRIEEAAAIYIDEIKQICYIT
jgi:hypothetical protein